MKFPLVSIIIVNFNGKEVFGDCLRSLEKIKYPNWELILVDNGSSDNSQNMVNDFNLSFKNFILIQNNRNLGFAPANNQGVEKSKGEYILLLNNDTKIIPDFLNKMVTKMEQDLSIGAMQPKIFLSDKRNILDNAGAYLTGTGFLNHWGFMEKDSQEFNQQRYIFSAKGACLLTRKKLINKIGLFDNDFVSYFEESDFCFRVWLAGFAVIFYPETYIYHKLGATSKKMDQIFVNFHAFKNRILSLFKNLSFINIFLILIPHIIIVLFLGIYYTLKFEFKKAWMIYHAIIWNVVYLSESLKKRSDVQKMRVKSDREIFKYILKETNFAGMFSHFKKVEANFNAE